MFCREHAAQLRPRIPDIEKAGASIVAVGNGVTNFIAGFRETTGFGGTVVVDPSLAAYRAAGLKRGLARILNPLGIGVAAYWIFGVNRIKRRAVGKRASQLPASGPPPEQVLPLLDEQVKATRMADLVGLVDRIARRPLLPGNRVTPMESGEEVYPAML